MKIKKIVLIAIPFVLAGSAYAYYSFNKEPDITYTTAEAKRGTIVQTVSETGTIKAVNEINLSFLNSGKINIINNHVGDIIKSGQIIAELDHSSLDLKRKEGEAALEVARQNLAKLIAGATAEEIRISRASVKQAETAYQSAKQDLENTRNSVSENISQAQKTLADLENKTNMDITTYEQAVSTAQNNLDSAKSTNMQNINHYSETALVNINDKLSVANNALDKINTLVLDNSDDLIQKQISVKNLAYLTNTRISYLEAKSLITSAQSIYITANSNKTTENIQTALSSALTALSKTSLSLQYCYSALENSITSSSFSQTTLDLYKTTISTQQTYVATGVSTLQSSQNNLNSAILSYNTGLSAAEESLAQANAAYNNALLNARNNYNSAQLTGNQQITNAQSKMDSAFESWQVSIAQLDKLTASPNKHDISLLTAQVSQAQASLDSINKTIEDSRIKAPIDGTITKVDNEIGEQVTIGKSVVYMLGNSDFEIEVLIPESDIRKIAKEDSTEITFDAFGQEEKFYGKVYFVDPAETTVQDVIYYKVKINFDSRERDVKSGMTANVVITTAKKDNVITIPSRAIIDRNGSGKFIKVLVSEKNISERKVEAGLQGDEGMIEILSGVNEGEKVVTYTNTK